MLSFTKKEIALIKKINTPHKVQDFLNKLEFNFEKKGPTLKSPIMVIRKGNAHCMEGALLASFLLSFHKYKTWLLHLEAERPDHDHVVTVFRENGFWGAISKTNHSVLRYREPIYKNIRELVLSYFHEYFLSDGYKTLRKYSDLLDMDDYEGGWGIADFDLWYLDQELDKIKHYNILPRNYSKKLRKADSIEIESGKIVEYEK